MSDIAWICAALIVIVGALIGVWVGRMFKQAAQKQQTEAQARVVASISREAVTVEQSMAQAQANAPADDAALQSLLKEGKF